MNRVNVGLWHQGVNNTLPQRLKFSHYSPFPRLESFLKSWLKTRYRAVEWCGDIGLGELELIFEIFYFVMGLTQFHFFTFGLPRQLFLQQEHLYLLFACFALYFRLTKLQLKQRSIQAKKRIPLSHGIPLTYEYATDDGVKRHGKLLCLLRAHKTRID